MTDFYDVFRSKNPFLSSNTSKLLNLELALLSIKFSLLLFKVEISFSNRILCFVMLYHLILECKECQSKLALPHLTFQKVKDKNRQSQVFMGLLKRELKFFLPVPQANFMELQFRWLCITQSIQTKDLSSSNLFLAL